MHRRKKSIDRVVILAVLVVLFMGARGRRDEPVGVHAPSAEAPRFAARGPHPVGMRDLTVERGAPLDVTMWYPAAAEAAAEEEIHYAYEIKLGKPLGTVTLATYRGRAAREAPADLSAGPFPLVILSPGFSLGASAYAWLAEHLASHGFVVIAPEHREHLDPENELWRAAVTRPQDVLQVLAYVDEHVTAGGTLSGLINRDLVALAGHSYGGYTSLAAAGARWDTQSFQSRCTEAQESEHPAAWLCDQLLPHLTDMAGLAGLSSVPAGLWPAQSDEGVDAVVSMAGDAYFFGPAGLAEITVPVLALGGTLDADTPFLWGTQPTYEHVSSTKKVRVALSDAGHMLFTGTCEDVRWYLRFFADEFCSDPNWDRKHAHAMIAHFTTAFLLAELKGSTDAAAGLDMETVDLPGIAYKSAGY